MRTNGIVTNENNVVDYLIETQAYIETLKKELIRKIVKSQVDIHPDISSIERLLKQFLSVN